MPSQHELEATFWKSLKTDMTVMLGLEGIDESHMRPMTAQTEGDHGPIWFFSAHGTEIVDSLELADRAFFSFASKGNEVWASVHGTLSLENDREMINRLWNPFVAAWYEGGKEDPKLALLRFDADRAEIWENGSSLLAGIKMLIGIDPKRDYRDKVAEVNLA